MIKRIALVLAVALAGGFFYYSYLLNIAVSKNFAVRNFRVNSGWGSVKIAEELEKSGFIRSSKAFVLYVWWKGTSSMLKSGDYELSESFNIKKIAGILSGGEIKNKEKTITLIEGWTAADIAAYLQEQNIMPKDRFLKAVGADASTNFASYEILKGKPENAGLEGYLFPDTYRIYSDADSDDIVKKMLDNLESKITAEMKQQIAANNMDVHQTLTLASIIEKEVPRYEDRKKVASIFYKRLNDGMPLQADSTVNFITGKNSSRASLEDTKINSPYNTYKNLGLPPGPIGNPGLTSISAAIYPEKNDYYYFLTTDDGRVIYSRTFEEHKANKAKYLQ
ncbi:endolytic transglycosylase MltG [Candidatus Parcubacteria bacterium]|nr:MAG: endolytic transglycosylase MltG [Candidatus Parcubacteria bacterium]